MSYVITRAILGVVVCTFVVSSANIDDNCGKTKTCRYFPDACDLANATKPCRFVSWTKSETVPDAITIELRSAKVTGENPYISVALGTMALMQNADMYLCNKGVLRSGAITSHWNVPKELPLSNDMSLLSSAITDGYLHCKFTRPFSVTKEIDDGTKNNYDITSSEYYILTAEGNMLGNAIDHHTWRAVTSDAVNFTTNFATEFIFKLPIDGTEAPETVNVTATVVPSPGSDSNNSTVVVTPESNINGAVANATKKAPDGSDVTDVVAKVPDGTNATQKAPDGSDVTNAPATTTSGSTSVFVVSWSLLFISFLFAQF